MTPSPALARFISLFMKDPDTNKINDDTAVSIAVYNLSKNDLISVKYELEELLSDKYSDKELVEIWRSCHPQYSYGNYLQRIFVQKAYDAVTTKLADSKQTYIVKKDAKDEA